MCIVCVYNVHTYNNIKEGKQSSYCKLNKATLYIHFVRISSANNVHGYSCTHLRSLTSKVEFEIPYTVFNQFNTSVYLAYVGFYFSSIAMLHFDYQPDYKIRATSNDSVLFWNIA